MPIWNIGGDTTYCKAYSPFLIYKIIIDLNSDCFYDAKDPFELKVPNQFNRKSDVSFWGPQFDFETIYVKFTCDEMPNEKYKEAWQDVENHQIKYRNIIDETIKKHQWNDLYGIDIDSIKGKIYVEKTGRQ